MKWKLITDTNEEKAQETLSKKNEYSIFNYLKEHSAVLLVVVSLATFFAETVTFILTRKELAFWELSSVYATFDTGLSVYVFIFAIIFTFLFILCSWLICSTFGVYFLYKKCHQLTKSFLANELSLVATSPKSKQRPHTKHENLENGVLEKIESFKKQSSKKVYRNLSGNCLVVMIIACINSLLLTIVTAPELGERALFVVFGAFFGLQLLAMLYFVFVIWITIIDKREIKSNCNDAKFITKTLDEYERKEYPINTLFKKGFQSIFTNSNIMLITIMLVLSCLLVCISSGFTTIDPTKNTKQFQITTIDGIPYAVVYQDSEKFYLEEVEVVIKENKKAEPEKVLTVYTDCQRIITTDDIAFVVDGYHEVVKAHKQDNAQETSKYE